MMKTCTHRRGSMYVAVIGCSMAVTVIGVGALLATRIEARSSEGIVDLTEARLYAQSAIDFGMWTIYNDSTWRSTRTSGAWKTDQPIGKGSFTLSVVDPMDGSFGNSKAGAVVLTGTGKLRNARYMLEATAVAEPVALGSLNTCLHATGNVTVSLLKSIGVTGAPLSMNGSINGPGTISGRVEAGSVGLLPIIVGTSQIPAPAKEMPEADVFDTYISLATAISPGNDFKDKVLTATYNPLSASLNPDGVYFINAGNNFTIEESRIQGTLIVRVPVGKKVFLTDYVFLHPHRTDYPTLMVDGDLQIDLLSSSSGLSEPLEGKNYNPAGAPYLGVTDADEADTYPNQVNGLIHVRGNLTINETSQLRGVVLVEGSVTVGGTVQVVHDSSIYANPPMGYVTYVMKLAGGSWRRVVSP